MADAGSGLQFYLSDVGRNQVLTREEEIELFKRVEEADEDARIQIISCNLKFVIQIAQKFRSRGMPLEDLIQEGNIGLLEAVGKFNYRLGFRFSTYAAFWIRQAIQVAIRQRGSLVRLPVRKARLLGFMNEVIQAHWSLQGRPPTETELAERLKIEPQQARELAQLGDVVLSLDAPLDEDGSSLIDLIPDPIGQPVERESLENERRDRIASVLGSLSQRENQVISERFGFKGGSTRSLRKVSARLGLSQEGVRRIEQRALAKLRRAHVRQAMVGLL
jgi:RNA polymerase primary sigma factor